MRRPISGALHVLGLRIGLRADSEELWARLEALYPAWLDQDARGAAVATFDLTLDRSGGQCHVAEGGAPTPPPVSWDKAVVDLQYRIDALVVASLRGYAIAHAGVVMVGSTLVVFPGPSRSGKSVLVAHLVASGARYYSDELAVVDRDGRVHAYPRPLLLRSEDGRPYHAPPPVARDADGLPPARPGAIVYLTYSPHSGPAGIHPVGKQRAMMELLKNTPQTWRTEPDLVRIFAKCLDSARVYAGRRGDAVDVGDAIRALARQ